MGRRSRRRERDRPAAPAAPESEYADAAGNVLVLRGSLPPRARQEYARTLAGEGRVAGGESAREDAEERDRSRCRGNGKEVAHEQGSERELGRDQRCADRRCQAAGHQAVALDTASELARGARLLQPGEQADPAQADAEHEVRRCRCQVSPPGW